ncbi:Serine/threonine-protein phosphatase 7 long form homolog [Linum perenne]
MLRVRDSADCYESALLALLNLAVKDERTTSVWRISRELGIDVTMAAEGGESAVAVVNTVVVTAMVVVLGWGRGQREVAARDKHLPPGPWRGHYHFRGRGASHRTSYYGTSLIVSPDERPVTDICEQWLGVQPPPNAIKGRTVRVSLVKRLFDRLPDGSTPEVITYHARAYTWVLVAGVLLADRNGDHIQWMPYADRNEDFALDGDILWQSVTPLLCIDCIAWHHPDRCIRQFGFDQRVPQDPEPAGHVEGLLAADFRSSVTDWVAKYQQFVLHWEQRDRHIGISELVFDDSRHHFHDETRSQQDMLRGYLRLISGRVSQIGWLNTCSLSYIGSRGTDTLASTALHGTIQTVVSDSFDSISASHRTRSQQDMLRGYLRLISGRVSQIGWLNTCSLSYIGSRGTDTLASWMPYADRTEDFALDGDILWQSVTPLLCIDCIAWHHLDRCIRQFGFDQRVPMDPVPAGHVEGLLAADFRSSVTDWVAKYQQFVLHWEQRDRHIGINRTEDFALDGDILWQSVAPLLCIDCIAWHHPDCCIRQFGFDQRVPQDPEPAGHVEGLLAADFRSSVTDWVAKYQMFVLHWEQRDRHIGISELVSDDSRHHFHDEYDEWYRRRTRMWMPYADRTEDFALDGDILWQSVTPLLCIDCIAWHHPDRCIRQFGFDQRVPMDPEPAGHVEWLLAADFRSSVTDWVAKYQQFVLHWEQRDRHIGINRTEDFALDGDILWQSVAPLLCIDCIAWHHPDCCIRQFGFDQRVPQDPEPAGHVEGLLAADFRSSVTDWVAKYQLFVLHWEQRDRHIGISELVSDDSRHHFHDESQPIWPTQETATPQQTWPVHQTGPSQQWSRHEYSEDDLFRDWVVEPDPTPTPPPRSHDLRDRATLRPQVLHR